MQRMGTSMMDQSSSPGGTADLNRMHHLAESIQDGAEGAGVILTMTAVSLPSPLIMARTSPSYCTG